ncbi:DUF192 domain-containing protein [Sedimentibacter sp. B4]|uniref:DUF192 domain-containing protein n=1 Tax=Sedimentibacter sp. B4 TaxID=304766 RepID=UPI0002F2BC7D|nr:DUF192 domain-containing protein [Sedimentibacter sp. B4]
MEAVIKSSIVIKNVKKADTFKARLIGLLNRKSFDFDEGLLLMKCTSIHCFFMKFTIDAVYLSNNMEVLYKETVKPWKIGKIVKNCAHVLELHEGAAKNISVGDIIVFCE